MPKKWLHDPEVEDVVANILGITPDLEYRDVWKDKEISDDEPLIQGPKISKPLTQETADEAARLLEDLNFRFGPKNSKLN